MDPHLCPHTDSKHPSTCKTTHPFQKRLEPITACRSLPAGGTSARISEAIAFLPLDGAG